MEDMAKMIGAVLSDDKEGFKSAFDSEMDTRLGEVIVNKNLDISKDIMTSTEEPVEEAYTFKSPSDAKKFVTSASNAGLTKRNFKIKGKTVDVSGVKDKEMNQMLQMLAKEMKAK
tara:strand:+ start:146 stop:490 length:345 start_codon:yes stop_codon:yes gene_type:complete